MRKFIFIFPIAMLTSCGTLAGIQQDFQATANRQDKTIQPSPTATALPVRSPITAIAPTVKPSPSNQPIVFNASVNSGTNCRKAAGKTSEVQQVLDAGVVALDRKSPVLVYGESWYLERHLGCYISESVVTLRNPQ